VTNRCAKNCTATWAASFTHLDCQPIIVGGVEDHVHLLSALSRTRQPEPGRISRPFAAYICL
jgi:hypothetical protein